MRSDYVNSDAFRLLINSMQYENGLALRVSLETGLRIGDVLKCRPWDLRGCKLSYTAEKTGKSGVKTLSKRLAAALRRISGNDWIFEGRYKTKTGHRTRSTVYKDLKKVCKRLGVEGQISPHSARKSYAVEDFHAHGLDHVKKELQHDDSGVTLLYALSDVISDAPKSEKQGEILALLRDIYKIVTDLQRTVRNLETNLCCREKSD
ncbi:MAG: tyrosine-type recombinase/integrase [Eubacteriales bacterium]